MKDSEKHTESEQLKKNQTQTLLLNTSELSIDQQKSTEQDKENNLKEVFIKENEN